MTFECVPGYEIANLKLLRTQCLDGVVKYPKCLKQGFCVLQETEMALNNIRYNKSTEIENGEVAVFECSEGKVPEESIEAKCQNTIIKYPRCIDPRPCDPPESSNGILIPIKDRYDSGSSINIQCEGLYVHNGVKDAKCEDGQWSELPQCLKPCTVSNSDLEKNHVELFLSEDVFKIHKHNTEIKIKCKKLFKRRGHLLAFCYDGIMKYQRCFSGSTCHIDQQQIDDNFLDLHDKHDGESMYGEGETVQFICKDGYFNRTSLTTTCAKPAELDNASTEPALAYPTCIRFGQSCGLPPSVQYGAIIEVERLTYPSGSSVNYKCANWYTLEGNELITCRHGEWDKEPICRAPCIMKTIDMLQNNIQLKYRLEEDKTKKIYSSHFDNTTFECAPGYGIPDVKSLRVQCLDGVQKYPKCLKEDNTISNALNIFINMNVTCLELGFCVIKQTELAMNYIRYSKGTVIENGQKVVFECTEGRVSKSSLEAECERGQIKYPKCISTRFGESCGPPPTIQYGDIIDPIILNYHSGSIVKYKCANVFVLEGNEQIACIDGEWGKEPTCKVPCTVATATMLENNIRWKYMIGEENTKKIYVPHLDYVSFECAPGYNIPDTKHLRTGCLNGVITYPKCLK
ncbi:coagulation factor XIII B chain-like [Mantella aurantiaca]